MNLGYQNAGLSKKKGFSGFKLERHCLALRLCGARSALTIYVYNMVIGNVLLATNRQTDICGNIEIAKYIGYFCQCFTLGAEI